GTLSSRLARGRAILARRLRTYGLAVPAAGLGMVAGPTAGALPPGLADATARLGVLVVAGEAVATAPVAALTEWTMKAMLLTRLKGMTAALVVGCAVLVAAGAGWRANAVGAADPPGNDAKRADAPRTTRDADKARIAELEQERDRLLKDMAALKAERDRLLKAVDLLKDQILALHLDARLQDQPEKGGVKPLPAPAIVPPTPVRPPLAPAVGNLPLPVPAAPEPVPDVVPTPVNPTPLTLEPDVVPSPTPRTSGLVTPQGPPPVRPATKPEAVPPAISVVRVYPVGDLAGDEGVALVKVVRATVDPKSWGVDAGVEYLPGRKALVVRQSAQGHEEVAQLLRLLKSEAVPARAR
ncbi:MAG: hypothetical protein JWO38_2282, partial [Gemmataceae bacterium]|nr:hypothetical protein [Gemmataceae bacterium]